MSTENNNNLVYENSLKILSDLISFKTISGENNNELIDYCDKILKKIGATSFRIFDELVLPSLNSKSIDDKSWYVFST